MKCSLARGKRAWMTTITDLPGRLQQPQGFAVDADGSAILCGGSQMVELAEWPGVKFAGWIVKMRGRTGVRAWTRSFFNQSAAGGMNGWLADVAVDGKGRIYAAGGWETTANAADGIVTRYSTAGVAQKLWTVAGEAAGYTDCRSLLAASSGVFTGGVLVTAAGESSFAQRLRP